VGWHLQNTLRIGGGTKNFPTPPLFSLIKEVQEVLGRTNRLPSLDDTDRTENDASNNSSLRRESVYQAVAEQQ
jgi:hypothetical protein